MNELALHPQFEVDLMDRRDALASMLPPTIRPEKFMSVMRQAMMTNPDLQKADKLSLWKAFEQAAADGLMPDGKEGVINIYYTKFKWKDENNVSQEKWIRKAQWMPMILGLRKRAIELANIYIQAEVVHKNDTYRVRRGDNPGIDHDDPEPGKDRGEMIACYAIFRKLLENGQMVILHREVMDAAQVAAVKSKSKDQDGMLWTQFTGEAWRKTVARRGIKSVPAVPDALTEIFKRDDEHFDFSRPASATVAGPAQMPPLINEGTAKPATTQQAALSGGTPMPPPMASAPMPPPMANTQPVDVPPSPTEEQAPPAMQSREDKFLAALEQSIVKATTLGEMNNVWLRNEVTIERKLSPEARDKAFAIWNKYEPRFLDGGKTA